MDEPQVRTPANFLAARRRRNEGHRSGFRTVMPGVVRAVRHMKLNLNITFS